MLKALQILKILKKEKFRFERTGTDIKSISINNQSLTLAIKELEELNNRSCENCKFFHQNYLCLHLGVGNIQPLRLGFSCCNKWETK